MLLLLSIAVAERSPVWERAFHSVNRECVFLERVSISVRVFLPLLVLRV